jgi:hypothetical protein
MLTATHFDTWAVVDTRRYMVIFCIGIIVRDAE